MLSPRGDVLPATLAIPTGRSIADATPSSKRTGIPVAVGALCPVFGLLLNSMIVAAALSLPSVSVIGNALRLRFVRL
jgi:hypothetical protein